MKIAIVGPTAIGKTKLSVELAKVFNGEIINADSTQIYKGLNIATAKVTEEEKEGIKHHLIDIKEVNEDYTIYDFQKDARNKIENIKLCNKIPIIVGGSGLYLSALIYDYKFQEENNNIDLSNISTEELSDKLISLNVKIDINNRKRLERAYIKYVVNQEDIDIKKAGSKFIYDDILIIGLTTSRDVLYERINNRVDQMLKNGLLDEASEIIDKYENCREINTVIGYKELIPYFNNEISLDEAVDKIKQNSRRFAKRQYTWFNNKMDVTWFNVDFDNFNNTVNEIIEFIKNKKSL